MKYLVIEYIQKNLEKIYDGFTYIVRRAEVVTCHYLNASNLIGALWCFLRAEDRRPSPTDGKIVSQLISAADGIDNKCSPCAGQ